MQTDLQPKNGRAISKPNDRWAAVWLGLVRDTEARHYKKMQKSIWLFLYLLLHANWETGFVVRRYKTIAADTGIKERTLRSWMTRLHQHKYIALKRNGRGLAIYILKWKTKGHKRRVA
jgi:hypothetical protein